MAKIPGVTCPHEKANGSPKSKKPPSNLLSDQQQQVKPQAENAQQENPAKTAGVPVDDAQFEMDI
jgi:hypothetical protein